MRYLVLVVLVASLVPASGDLQAQDPCAEAAAHVSGCSSFCDLAGAPEACAEVLGNVATGLSTECTDEQAEVVLQSTCAKLANQGSVAVGTNTCQQAADHMLGCFRLYCTEHPEALFCASLPDIEAAVANEEMYCGPDDAEEAMGLLMQSCDEINAMFGN